MASNPNNSLAMEDWLPGVLSGPQVSHLATEDYLQHVKPEAVSYSAVDLHLADDGYCLPEGSVKPFGERYLHQLKKQGLVSPLVLDNGTFRLDRNKTYLFPVRERLNLRKNEFQFWGQATAKSSVGRVDVLARLIVDGESSYEGFMPEAARKGTGEMYVEITPITFDVLVKPDIALTQLRIFKGQPSEFPTPHPVLYEAVLKGSAQAEGTLSVDLTPVEIGGLKTSAFVATRNDAADPIPLWKDALRPAPWKYWRFAVADTRGRLRIEENNFYILRSKERIALPPGIAVYCRASDETIGEMRIHYAGFVHPNFGREHADIGTPLIFEVRGHNVNVSLRDGETMARLIFYRMSSDAEPSAEPDSPYEGQNLQLSKFFGEWPQKLREAGDGRVEPNTP
jgi:dCTP deaminase